MLKFPTQVPRRGGLVALPARGGWQLLGSLALSLAAVLAVAPVQATTILIDDSGETLSFKIDGNTCVPLGTPGARCTTGIFGSGADIAFIGERAITRIFTSFPSTVAAGRFGALLTENAANDISDFVFADITDLGLGIRQTFFSFVSDPLTPGELDDPLVKALIKGKFFTRETGDEQDMGGQLRDATGTLGSLPFDLTLIVKSDRAPDVAEPHTTVLIGLALVALVAIRRRRGQASA